jgi:hypothetical protein
LVTPRLARFVPALLPETIQPKSSTGRTDSHRNVDDETDTEVDVRDSQLRVRDPSKKLFLRQVVVSNAGARITNLWWALYDDWRRSDVWYFQMDPEQNDAKILSNYEIESVLATDRGVELQIWGTMFRPQGAWWITGKVFSFSLSGDSLTLASVRNDFGIFQSYDLGDVPPSIDVTTERETDKGFEIRSYDTVPKALLRQCGFRNPLSEYRGKFVWTEFERAARCVTKTSNVPAFYRGLDEPSFVERGGDRRGELR